MVVGVVVVGAVGVGVTSAGGTATGSSSSGGNGGGGGDATSTPHHDYSCSTHCTHCCDGPPGTYLVTSEHGADWSYTPCKDDFCWGGTFWQCTELYATGRRSASSCHAHYCWMEVYFPGTE